MSALFYALRGDEALFKAIDEADPDTFGVSCSECGTYYVGRFSKLDPAKACCPKCGVTRGACESPALGDGPEAANEDDHGKR